MKIAESKRQYFKMAHKWIKAAAEAYDIRPAVLAAITGFETGWGTSANLKIGKNPGGITFNANRKTPHYEYDPEKGNRRKRPASEGGWYNVYDSFEKGYLDNALVLKGSRYDHTMDAQNDDEEFARRFVNSGYFADSNKSAYFNALVQNIPIFQYLFDEQEKLDQQKAAKEKQDTAKASTDGDKRTADSKTGKSDESSTKSNKSAKTGK